MKKFYYTIGEVANLLNLKPHVLRYWEKEFSQLHPRKREGRNRRYNPEDIELLKKIKYMLYIQKFTIEGVRRKLKEMKRNRFQTEIDFSIDKKEVKKQVVKDLREIKELLRG